MRQRQAETGLFEIERSINGYERQIAAKLGDLTWDKEIVNFTFEDVLSEVPNTIDSNRLIKTAFEMRPDFRVIERQYLRQKSLLEKARLLRRPDLSALAKWGKQGRGFSENEAKEMNDKSWSVGLVYNISFGPEPSNLDFYSQKEKLLAFEARIAQKRDEVIIAVNESQERLEFYKKNLELLRASEKLASEVLDGQKLNFQLGKISLLDLTVYQQDYDNAGISLIQGEARLIQEWLALLYETGELSRYLDVGTGKDFVRRQNTIIVAEENE
jgi:outer membrane protein TolC